MDIYFDNAATSSPKPQCVTDEVIKALTDFNANPGRSGHAAALKAAHCVYNARSTLSAFLHAEEGSCIAFQFNCTDALNLAIKGILHRGDHVISTLLEHNSVLRVLSGLSSRRYIDLTLISPKCDGLIDPEEIRKSLRKNTRLVVITHASNVTGAIQPVAAVCRISGEYDIPCLIDGAQALGTMPVDMQKLGCSMYAFPGHKSLLGPQGTGGLYIRSGIFLHTVREGGTGTDSDSMLQPDEAPERYESGTLNLPGIAGLSRGVEYVREHLAKIMMHERELTSALYEGLKSIRGTSVYSPSDEASRCGIVSFNLNDLSSSELADMLNQRGIAVRGGLHCAPGAHRFLGTMNRGAVRASIGWANTFGEVDRFLAHISEISKNT